MINTVYPDQCLPNKTMMHGGMMFPKPTRWTSPKYLNWIRKQTCVKCGAPAEPHHLKGIGHLSGGGLKSSDAYSIPLCHPCHNEMHQNPELWKDQWEMVARTLAKAIHDGYFKEAK